MGEVGRPGRKGVGAHGVLTEEKRRQLATIYAALNPVTLLRQIRETVEYLWTLAERRQQHQGVNQ